MNNLKQTVPKMKAIVQYEYGSPDVLKLEEVDRPVIFDKGVLVKVRGAAVHAGDWHLMRGKPFFIRFIYGGLGKPQTQILGCDVAGVVEAVGRDVTQFQPGDVVFGDLSESGFGAFAEYVCAPETAFAIAPSDLSFEEAATVPVSALTALQGLRDVGQIQPGYKVLINGASGGVGSFAVQIAKAFGAEVTAVCSEGKIEMVKSIGADYVWDYTQVKSKLKQHYYDLILDNAAYNSPFNYFPFLKTPGTYVAVGGSMGRLFQAMFLDFVTTKIGGRKIKCLVCKPNQSDLIVLKDMIEAGKIRPYVDRVYPLGEVPAAINQLEQRQVRGKVAISIDG
ncbi:NAD(P)-dependent alcohol dehydrogenase [Calothrix sp. NIES-3974]|uniref:NAD(P)-dependent alcohol dehydrogenase n=1 Tax=Calothrix sp. NIES-3974 TaxID=2005462 RepID=UPI000B5E31DD|nr:NAD(P)-dependent alcohol dehydrogenase [Calothrix sp. NIES-3974]BAZ05565.1 zinc-binding oxidoreductase [Calothrix sp. NIES-3974]